MFSHSRDVSLNSVRPGTSGSRAPAHESRERLAWVTTFTVTPLYGNDFTVPETLSTLTDAEVLGRYGLHRRPPLSHRRRRTRSAPVRIQHIDDDPGSDFGTGTQRNSSPLVLTFSIFSSGETITRSNRYLLVKHRADQDAEKKLNALQI